MPPADPNPDIVCVKKWSPPPFSRSPFLQMTPTDARDGASPAEPSSKTAELDSPLHAFGFQIGVVSPSLVDGRFRVSETCCQPFKVLHGGLSALIAEALASIGAHAAAGFRRIAGIQLSINHHRPAALGDDVFAEARPVSVGKNIQVWEVRLWRETGVVASTEEGGDAKKDPLLASARVMVLTNVPAPAPLQGAGKTLRKYARL